MGLYALLEPARLLDLLAHFVVFEIRESKIVKKICRYHQFRGVNKIIDRVIKGDHAKGLIWHTQGSAYSGPCRTLIPFHAGHRFRTMPDTDSGDAGQRFRNRRTLI
jgi:hypothetical protein